MVMVPLNSHFLLKVDYFSFIQRSRDSAIKYSAYEN